MMIAKLRIWIMHLRWFVGTNSDYACDHCGRAYAGYSVPDEVWRSVYPDGGGQLCLDCLTLELEKRDHWTGWFCYPQQWKVERAEGDYLTLLGEHDRLHNILRAVQFNIDDFRKDDWRNGFYERPTDGESEVK